MDADEKKWRAESDARTLAEAKVIEKDTTRLEAAQEAAKGLAKELKKDAEAMMSTADIMFGELNTKEDE
jgi:hypothetical protein